MIQPERLKFLNAAEVRAGDCVLYWMQASPRVEYNHAFQYAVRRANALRLPVVVYFGLTDRFPEANERHYAFLLEGLADVRRRLNKLGVGFVFRRGSPERGAVELAQRAALAVVDRGYLRIQKEWRAKAARAMDCPLVQVETDAVVPVEAASPKEEWSRTPEEGFAAALRLNNKYELDGRDPNGFTGVAWCFGKHDRPWGQRPVFGLVRSMTDGGLRRKFDADRYVQNIEALTAGRG
jgi:deoxyribodipyrimidine photolyase